MLNLFHDGSKNYKLDLIIMQFNDIFICTILTGTNFVRYNV
jgi:hypothetical protein